MRACIRVLSLSGKGGSLVDNGNRFLSSQSHLFLKQSGPGVPVGHVNVALAFPGYLRLSPSPAFSISGLSRYVGPTSSVLLSYLGSFGGIDVDRMGLWARGC